MFVLIILLTLVLILGLSSENFLEKENMFLWRSKKADIESSIKEKEW